ncbi:V-type proton ATPase subunit G1-like [Prunus avium]|uniref:V-type proton ATPase subunit G n=1 Tax=Prunus avium TaxID=42229 RepID=A0A6P5RGN2_PRUAV|nr:V-type proton ATPase subunit G1-like [Prunus avium]XP_021802120.1 V-type proton ATPase subunit G1-like [Prunus avium]
MDSVRGQGSIQMLLTAEQDAQHIVNSARTSKTARLRQAKDEAEREVQLYRTKMEAEYQKMISDTSGSSGSNVKRLEEETDAKIKNLKESSSKVRSDIVSMLMKYVTTVKT